jgi:hypothetical protein
MRQVDGLESVERERSAVMGAILYAATIAVMGWMAYRGTYLLVTGWRDGYREPILGAGLLAGAFVLCAALAGTMLI